MTRPILVVFVPLTALALALVFLPMGGTGDPPVAPPLELSRGHAPGMEPILTALHPHPTQPEWLLATGPHRASYVTRDRGRSWEAVLLVEPWPRRDLGLADGPAGWAPDGRLIATRGGERHASSDGGLTFEELLEPVVTLPGAPAATTPGGDWRLDGGLPQFRAPGTTTWEPRPRGLDHPLPAGLVQHPDTPDWLGLVDAHGRLWASADFGGSWAATPVEAVQEAVFLDGGEPTWLVRTDLVTLVRATSTSATVLGPEPEELPRLVVPPYLEQARDQRHQQAMLARMMRKPTIQAAGLRDDGGLWVHIGGIDATRSRWTRSAEGRWTSEEPDREAAEVRAWGTDARLNCRVSLQGRTAFVRDAPVPEAPEVGEALAVGFVEDDVLYVVSERGVHLRSVASDCSIGEELETWHWAAPELRRVVVRPRAGSLGVIGIGETGVWRRSFAPAVR